MNRPFEPADDGRKFRLRESGDVGRLEAPPLHDPGTSQLGQGILWVPGCRGIQSDYWAYVTPEDVDELQPK